MKKKISIFTPCYNEEGNLEKLCDSIKKVMLKLPEYDYEHIISDNASTDRSPEILRKLAKNDKHIKVIFNIKNFGPGRSGMHGFLQCNGDAVISLASDLQDPPEMIPEFVKAWEKGAYVVWGQKLTSEEKSFMFKVRTLYYRVINVFSENNVYEHVTGMGIYDKKVVDDLREMNEPYPILRFMITDLGYPIELLQYEQQERASGKSSYNFWSYLDTAIHSLTATSTIPLRVSIYIGLIMSIISFVSGLAYLIYKLTNWNSFQIGMAPLICGMFFLGSIQLIFIGVLGEYIGNILSKVEKKPLVIEKERINFDENE